MYWENARNANESTWYVLRYRENFVPRDLLASPDPGTPRLSDTLFFDEARGLLELRTRPAEHPVEPLPGLAVDAGGEIYAVEPRTGRLLVRCGSAERELLCEPHVLAGPRGLALDRRGLLYVADARARRVVVLRPDTGTVAAVLGMGVLHEPVDVAVSPSGRIHVADRAAGRIVVFHIRNRVLAAFAPRNAAGLPAEPRPIAVMSDRDESLWVADASHPRLLHFAPDGAPRADEELATVAARLPEDDPSLEAVLRLEERRAPRFVAGACCPPRPSRDGGEWLADVHRALRIRRLALARRFESEGLFVSAALDAGAPGTVWHKVEVDAELPEGTSVSVETATADALDALDLTLDASWDAPRDRRGEVVPVTNEVPDQLVQSGPGRYAWLRVRLRSEGGATPSVRSIRVLYPRNSYLEMLPAVYRRDPEGVHFLERYLALFEHVLTGVEDRYEEFSRELDLDAAPLEVANWLGCLVDLSFDPSWPLERRRALLAEAMDLYRKRGTPEGIRRYVEIYTGRSVRILEAFLRRPRGPAFLGRPGTVLGCLHLAKADRRPPAEALYRDHAHRFTVLVYLDDDCDEELVLPVVERIVSASKPAHTAHRVCRVAPDARVGAQSQVGLDFVLGGRGAAGTQLGGREDDGVEAPPSTLGVDSVLGRRRPGYVRPFERIL